MKKEPRTEFVRLSAVAHMLSIAPLTAKTWAEAGRLPPITRISPRICGWPADVIEPAVARLLSGGRAAA